MAELDHADVVIIGGGVVGCAIFRRLAIAGLNPLLLERGADILSGASKGNSAILHTGFDAPTGSLEVACMQAGYREYLAIHEKLNLPLMETGALVIAWDEAQMQRLPGIVAQAHANGVTDVTQISREEVRRREPRLADHALGAVHVPDEQPGRVQERVGVLGHEGGELGIEVARPPAADGHDVGDVRGPLVVARRCLSHPRHTNQNAAATCEVDSDRPGSTAAAASGGRRTGARTVRVPWFPDQGNRAALRSGGRTNAGARRAEDAWSRSPGRRGPAGWRSGPVASSASSSAWS